MVLDEIQKSYHVVVLLNLQGMVPVLAELPLTGGFGHVCVQSTVLVDGLVPRVLSQHLKALCVIKVMAAVDNPVAAEDFQDLLGGASHKRALTH